MSEEIVEGQNPAVNATGIQETGAGTQKDEEVRAKGAEPAELASDLDPGTQLTPGQMTLLAALVGNPDVPLAAKAAGVCRTTAYQWMKAPGFKEELTRQRNEVFLDALAAVKTHATQAVTQLAGLLSEPDTGLRRKVCTDILDRAMKAHDLLDLERRIAA